MHHPRILLTLACTLALLSSSGGQARPYDDMVKTSATATKVADGKQTVKITLDIKPGWRIYANPVGNEDLESLQARVTIRSQGKPLVAKIQYPPGKVQRQKNLPNFTYILYEGKVEVQAQIERTVGDANPLEVEISYTEHDHCLPRRTVRITVP